MTSYFQALTLDGVKLNNRLRAVKEGERRKSSCISPAPNVLMFCMIILINALKVTVNNSFFILCRSNMGSSQNRYIAGYMQVWGIPIHLVPIPIHLVPPCTAYGKSFSCLILLHPSCDSMTVLQCSCPAQAAPPSSKLLELKPLSGSRSCSTCEKGVPGRSPNNSDPEFVMQ